MDETQPKWFGGQPPHNRHFVIFLPSRDRNGNAIKEIEKLSEAVARILCGFFGGITSYPATGLFQRDTGTIQKEAVVVLECFCEAKTWERQSQSLRHLITILSGLLDQESIACSLDGEMIFVPPSEADFRLSGEIDRSTLAELLSREMNGSDGPVG